MNKQTKKVDRSGPPDFLETDVFKMPDFFSGKLAGGAKIYVYEDKKRPLVTVAVLIGTGAAGEEAPGLSRLAVRLTSLETKKRDATTLALDVERLGARLGSAITYDGASLSATALAEHFDEITDALAECFFEPAFSAEETERERKKQISSVSQKLASSSYLASAGFNKVVFVNTAYENPLLGTRKSVENFGEEDCRSRFEEMRDNSRISFIVAGNVDAEETVKKFDNVFGAIKSGGYPEIELAKPNKATIAVVNSKKSLQTSVRIGKPAPLKNSPDYPKVQMTNTIFGGYFLSRLNKVLREEKGLTYGAGSKIDARLGGSNLVIVADVAAGKALETLQTTVDVMAGLSGEELSNNEFETAKNYFLGSFLRNSETASQIASMLQNIDTHGFADDYPDRFYDAIASLKLEDLREVRKKYFSPDGLTAVFAGDAEALKKELSAFGEIREIDPEEIG